MCAAEEELLPRGVLGRWMAGRTAIWQMQPLDQEEFARFVSARGLGYSAGSDIQSLWQTGLLKADMVQSDSELEIPGLEPINGGHSASFVYVDVREVSFPAGLSNILDRQPAAPTRVALFFHPFRYHVLYNIDLNLGPRFHRMQQLLYSEGYRALLEAWQSFFDRRTSQPDLPQAVRYWESVTELAVSAEPYFYERLFGVFPWRIEDGREKQREAIAAHWHDASAYYRAAGVERLERARQTLCVAAETLDPNKAVHTLLRLSATEQRITHVKGTLGASMLLLTMAEILRRGAEEVFGIELPEEDEKGFGITYSQAKEKLYGSKRILDGDQAVTARFLRSQGLASGIRVCWYVEGETEYHALETVLAGYPEVELINLRGRVVERGDRGVSFRDSLRNDLRAERFSFVLLDADRVDNIRAVRKAAEDDELCGAFHISQPDFEFGDFTLAELGGILWSIAEEMGAAAADQNRLEERSRACRTGKSLLAVAREAVAELAQVGKGEEWGRRLMLYALEHPEWTARESAQPTLRPVLSALQLVLDATSANYKLSRESTRVDPNSGLPVDRSRLG